MWEPHRVVTWFARLALVSLLSACSDLSTGDETRGAPNPCLLLSSTEIDDVVIRTVDHFSHQNKSTGNGCVWYDANNVGIYTASFTTDALPSGNSLAGLGVPAVLNAGAAISATFQDFTLFSQSNDPVKDVTVSANVQAASSVDSTQTQMATSEASYRLAQKLLSRL